jgi:hypothetical protein
MDYDLKIPRQVSLDNPDLFVEYALELAGDFLVFPVSGGVVNHDGHADAQRYKQGSPEFIV